MDGLVRLFVQAKRWPSVFVAGAAAIFIIAASQPAAAAESFNPLFSLCLASNPPMTPEALWRSWSLAPQVMLPLLLVLALYSRGYMALRRMETLPPGWQVACAVAGVAVLCLALISPLCRLAATLASAHMVQHLLLVAVAPPLLALGRPLPVLNAALPQGWQGELAKHGNRLARGWRRHGGPFGAAVAYGAAIWLWHAPVVYRAVLVDPVLHTIAYAGLIGISFVYWAALMTVDQHSPSGYGGVILSLLTTLMHTGLLGALLTFSSVAWYPILSNNAALWHLTPIADQQLAGLIMWVPMGAIYLVGSLAAAAAWMTVAARPASAGH